MAQLHLAIQPLHTLYPWQRDIANTLSWLDCLEESILSKDKQVFVLKDSISKGMDFANDPLPIKHFLHLPTLALQETNNRSSMDL